MANGQKNEKCIRVHLGEDGYDIRIGHGLLSRAGEILPLDRRVLVVTDDGVPPEYAQSLAAQCQSGHIHTIPQGEEHKTLETFGGILSALLRLGFTRSDCVVAVGGGIPGDVAGFAAACYMRGIDFYNIPSTSLSQIDSSIGGKTAVNLDGVKNTVGAFYQPKAVIVDPELLRSLPERQLMNGLAEALKMALTSDAELFSLFETGGYRTALDTVIEKSLLIKRDVVQADERESGLRRVLNFGHTIGHGIECRAAGAGLYHGECVALGMLPMCAPEVRSRLEAVLTKMNLPVKCRGNAAEIGAAILHDKKRHGDTVTAVFVPRIGSFEFREMNVGEWNEKISEVLS